MSALGSLQNSHVDAAVALQLHIEDMEDWKRRNNLRLWGLPEENWNGRSLKNGNCNLP